MSKPIKGNEPPRKKIETKPKPKPVTGKADVAAMYGQAAGIISRFDANGDGKISRDEAKARADMGGGYSYDLVNRVNDDYVKRTTVTYTRDAAMQKKAFDADVDADGFLTAEEMVEATLRHGDTNHNSKLNNWELFWSAFSVPGLFQGATDTRQTKQNKLEYDPLPEQQRK